MSKPFAHERRKATDHTAGDRVTKQLIICTVCLIAVLVTITMCYLAIQAVGIPDQIDRLATLLVGALVGSLVKTGVDRVMGGEGEPAIKTEITNTAANPAITEDVNATEESEVKNNAL
jgi:hypothetical protein